MLKIFHLSYIVRGCEHAKHAIHERAWHAVGVHIWPGQALAWRGRTCITAVPYFSGNSFLRACQFEEKVLIFLFLYRFYVNKKINYN